MCDHRGCPFAGEPQRDALHRGLAGFRALRVGDRLAHRGEPRLRVAGVGVDDVGLVGGCSEVRGDGKHRHVECPRAPVPVEAVEVEAVLDTTDRRPEQVRTVRADAPGDDRRAGRVGREVEVGCDRGPQCDLPERHPPVVEGTGRVGRREELPLIKARLRVGRLLDLAFGDDDECSADADAEEVVRLDDAHELVASERRFVVPCQQRREALRVVGLGVPARRAGRAVLRRTRDRAGRRRPAAVWRCAGRRSAAPAPRDHWPSTTPGT